MSLFVRVVVRIRLKKKKAAVAKATAALKAWIVTLML
jgi:hypothetical protein